MHFAHVTKASANFRNHAPVRYSLSRGECKSPGLLLLAGHLGPFGGKQVRMANQPRAFRPFHGAVHAKEQPEHVMVKRLPSKMKDMLMRFLFLPVLSAAILIGGETVVLPQVAVRVV